MIRKLFSKTMLTAIVIVGILLISVGQNLAYAQAFKRLHVGDDFRYFSLKDNDGLTINLNDFKGLTIGIIFWKHPSLRSPDALIAMRSLYREYGLEKNFQVIGVYSPIGDTTPTLNELDEMSNVISDTQIDFPNLIDDGLKVFSDLGIVSFPSFCIVSPKGQVVYIQAGLPTFGGQRALKKHVKSALGIAEEIKVASAKYQPKGKSNFYYRLATEKEKRGQLKKAIKDLKKSIQIDPEYNLPHYLMGNIYSKLGQSKKAYTAYQEAIKRDDSFYPARSAYAFLCLESDKLDEAIIQFEELIASNPSFTAEPLFGMGTIYYQRGMLDQAQQKLLEAADRFVKEEQSTQLGPMYSRAHVHAILADIYERQQKIDAAIKEYQTAGSKYETLIKAGMRMAE